MRINIRTCDDWVAVYKDGRKVEENHSVSLERGLEALGIGFDHIDFDVDDNGVPIEDAFPERLPE